MKMKKEVHELSGMDSPKRPNQTYLLVPRGVIGPHRSGPMDVDFVSMLHEFFASRSKQLKGYKRRNDIHGPGQGSAELGDSPLQEARATCCAGKGYPLRVHLRYCGFVWIV